jgi:hypothetical protein
VPASPPRATPVPNHPLVTARPAQAPARRPPAHLASAQPVRPAHQVTSPAPAHASRSSCTQRSLPRRPPASQHPPPPLSTPHRPRPAAHPALLAQLGPARHRSRLPQATSPAQQHPTPRSFSSSLPQPLKRAPLASASPARSHSCSQIASYRPQSRRNQNRTKRLTLPGRRPSTALRANCRDRLKPDPVRLKPVYILHIRFDIASTPFGLRLTP